MLPLYVLELGVPWYAERQGGLPWHRHHIAERYGLLAIIALGEGVVGTIAALGALLDAQGWTTDTVLLLISGMAVTFAMWWVYFVLPHGELLDVRRGAAPLFTVLHYPLYMAIAAAATGIVALGAPVMLGILVASLAPAVTIAGYEWRGHHHLQGEVAQLQSSR